MCVEKGLSPFQHGHKQYLLNENIENGYAEINAASPNIQATRLAAERAYTLFSDGFKPLYPRSHRIFNSSARLYQPANPNG
tara:strand:- start:200 stop:442 length:243 start_codon:yes stop_codon:yes gene_type:complete